MLCIGFRNRIVIGLLVLLLRQCAHPVNRISQAFFSIFYIQVNVDNNSPGDEKYQSLDRWCQQTLILLFANIAQHLSFQSDLNEGWKQVEYEAKKRKMDSDDREAADSSATIHSSRWFVPSTVPSGIDPSSLIRHPLHESSYNFSMYTHRSKKEKKLNI